jgi:hypothetical protein
MADPSQGATQPAGLVAATVDQFLLSLAEGILHAQEALNRLQVVDPLGRPGTTYYLPRLDFELRVTAELVQGPTALPLRPAVQPFSEPTTAPRQRLVLRPVQAAETATSGFKAEVISTIRGSFVAVPPNDGKPALVVTPFFEKVSARRYTLSVRVSTAIGEPVSGQEAHFNIDLELSRALSAIDGVALTVPKPGTHLEHGVVPTDVQGRAATGLDFDTNEVSGAQIAVLIDVMGKTERVIVAVPPAAAG